MPRYELLPGVTSASCPPAATCDAHAAIRNARRRAWVRDGLQLALLIAVDALFIDWQQARLPFSDRADSLMVLAMMNLVILTHLWLARVVPVLRARRIAATWSRSERARFGTRASA